MLNLSLIRHADSDLINFNGNDMSRPISSQGVEKTEKILYFLKKKKYRLKKFFCSPSRRTIETLQLLGKISHNSKIQYLDNLYHPSGVDIFDTVMLNAKKQKVLIVSHEPLLSCSIDNFFNGSENKHFFNAVEEYTTSALSLISFKCKEWNEIEKSKAIINFYVKPKDL